MYTNSSLLYKILGNENLSSAHGIDLLYTFLKRLENGEWTRVYSTAFTALLIAIVTGGIGTNLKFSSNYML